MTQIISVIKTKGILVFEISKDVAPIMQRVADRNLRPQAALKSILSMISDQQSKAMSIYRTLRVRGETYLKRKQPDFEKLSKKIDALVSLSETKNKQKVVNELADERLRLEKPIIELFNKQLKPRLTSLLTRKQKARGEMK
ncbi:MAG: hypothetical protein IH986_02865 [Planctomycetes bacterium]|nr:hypothetical protein [Planctomycetota bacterium]